MTDEASPADVAQQERAAQTWTLQLDVEGSSLSSPVQASLFKAVRIKRSERERFLANLPGPIRRGARVDLEPVAERIRALGLACRILRTRRDR